MGAEPPTENQRMALSVAIDAQNTSRAADNYLRSAVRDAVGKGVPLLTLANQLGVSRSRIRRLAR